MIGALINSPNYFKKFLLLMEFDFFASKQLSKKYLVKTNLPANANLAYALFSMKSYHHLKNFLYFYIFYLMHESFNSKEWAKSKQ